MTTTPKQSGFVGGLRTHYYWVPALDSKIAPSMCCWSNNSGPAPGWDVTEYFRADDVRAHLSAYSAAAEAMREALEDCLGELKFLQKAHNSDYARPDESTIAIASAALSAFDRLKEK